MTGFVLEEFEACPVLGILRGITQDQLSPVLETIVQAGLRFVEVTLNTANACSLIRQATQEFGQKLVIGAGTVLSPEDAREAVEAGATFLVGPTLNHGVAEFCRENQVPYMPGAFTPSEIENAWQAGATLVKVFPASHLGPGFFKEMKGPFSDIKLMAVGGVRAENVRDYLNSGAVGLAVGGSIFARERLEAGQMNLIRQDLVDILIAVRDI